jgi:Family of unknown function (DUF6516)
MNVDEYLDVLDAKLREISAFVTASAIHREIDVNTNIGFLKGQITFVDGSRFEFSEQLPTERTKFRLHYMDASGNLITRWDSAPHYKELPTFPFHRHTSKGVQAHDPVTTLDALEKIVKMLKL